MKTHTNQFKENVKLFGRELNSIITYELNGETIELGSEELNSISPHYEGGILKSVMKQLDIDSNVDIPLGTVLNYQFGVKVDEEYEYINFGNYIVYSVEKQEDTKSYKIICYDKMLNSMKNYENMNITYPITIRNYINEICNYLGLSFKNINDEFVNYNKEIDRELYISNDDSDLGYTFRDVFDELTQVTASCICINEETDELEIRYINNTNDIINEEYLKDINVNFGEKYGPVNSIVLSRSAESDNVYLRNEQSVENNGLCEIKIKDNQIMNFNNRDEFLPEILQKLNGLEYYLNDFSSTGITYYNLCDRYTITIEGNNYSCIMFNDEVNITQGLEENIHTDLPKESETDYNKADKTDRRINQAYIMVDKQQGQIESLINEQTATSERLTQTIQNVFNIQNLFQVTGGNNLIKNSVGLFKNNNWLVPDGANVTFGEDANLIGRTTSASKISLSQTTISTTADNITNLTLDTVKTLSYKIRQDADTTTTITLYGLDRNNPIYQETFTGEISWEEIFDEEKSKIFPDSPNLILEISSSSTYDGGFEISDLMLNDGEKQSWTPASGEIWGEIIRLNMQGITCYSLQGGIATLMTTLGFQVRELYGSELGNIITQLTNIGLETRNINISGDFQQKDMVHTVIKSSSNDVYVDYIVG